MADDADSTPLDGGAKPKAARNVDMTAWPPTGRLRVIARAEDARDGAKRWRCLCDPELGGCGTEKIVIGRHLRSGAIRSCGCLRREVCAATDRSKDRVGLPYGRLRVESRASNAGRRSRWECLCDPELGGCGNRITVRSNNLDHGQVSCGCARGREPVRAKHLRAATRAYQVKRMQEDPRYALETRVRTLLHQSLKVRGASKRGSLWTILGYSREELERRLLRTMPKGFGWEDFLAGRLHIDHIIPLAAFNYSDEDHHDFKRAWARSNLRLLPAGKNMSKGDTLDRPFQPGLAF